MYVKNVYYICKGKINDTMSIILQTIKDNFGTSEDFTAWEIHLLTKINYKVVQMNLKKMHNKCVLYHNQNTGDFRLYSDEEIFNRRQKENDLIDKYQLKQPKYKI